VAKPATPVHRLSHHQDVSGMTPLPHHSDQLGSSFHELTTPGRPGAADPVTNHNGSPSRQDRARCTTGSWSQIQRPQTSLREATVRHQ
jgi:hypothetical protein